MAKLGSAGLDASQRLRRTRVRIAEPGTRGDRWMQVSLQVHGLLRPWPAITDSLSDAEHTRNGADSENMPAGPYDPGDLDTSGATQRDDDTRRCGCSINLRIAFTMRSHLPGLLGGNGCARRKGMVARCCFEFRCYIPTELRFVQQNNEW